MTYNVLMGTLNPTHSLARSLTPYGKVRSTRCVLSTKLRRLNVLQTATYTARESLDQASGLRVT